MLKILWPWSSKALKRVFNLKCIGLPWGINTCLKLSAYFCALLDETKGLKSLLDWALMLFAFIEYFLSFINLSRSFSSNTVLQNSFKFVLPDPALFDISSKLYFNGNKTKPSRFDGLMCKSCSSVRKIIHALNVKWWLLFTNSNIYFLSKPSRIVLCILQRWRETLSPRHFPSICRAIHRGSVTCEQGWAEGKGKVRQECPHTLAAECGPCRCTYGKQPE